MKHTMVVQKTCRTVGIIIQLVALFLFFDGRNIALAGDGNFKALRGGDCVKCHPKIVARISNGKNKHASAVECLDCHPEHPPGKKNTVLSCGECHEGSDHFQIDDCLQCHIDPHQPLHSLQDTIKPAREACVSCHADVGKEMTVNKDHAKLYCTTCHERHHAVPSCLDCHRSHMLSQPGEACKLCHPPHNPQNVVAAWWVPASYCQVCHKEEGNELASSESRHSAINCIYCHKGTHPAKKNCRDCHGLPHDQATHIKYRSCVSECHGDAHLLISGASIIKKARKTNR